LNVPDGLGFIYGGEIISKTLGKPGAFTRIGGE